MGRRQIARSGRTCPGLGMLLDARDARPAPHAARRARELQPAPPGMGAPRAAAVGGTPRARGVCSGVHPLLLQEQLQERLRGESGDEPCTPGQPASVRARIPGADRVDGGFPSAQDVPAREARMRLQVVVGEMGQRVLRSSRDHGPARCSQHLRLLRCARPAAGPALHAGEAQFSSEGGTSGKQRRGQVVLLRGGPGCESLLCDALHVPPARTSRYSRHARLPCSGNGDSLLLAELAPDAPATGYHAAWPACTRARAATPRRARLAAGSVSAQLFGRHP